MKLGQYIGYIMRNIFLQKQIVFSLASDPLSLVKLLVFNLQIRKRFQGRPNNSILIVSIKIYHQELSLVPVS